MHNLFKKTEVRRLKPDAAAFVKAAGTGDTLTSDKIDTLNYTDVAIMIALGAVVDAGACTVKLQQSSDDGSTDTYDDIAGSKYTIGDTDDNLVHLWDVFKPQKRYLKVITTRATQNLTVDGLFVFLGLPGNVPVSQGATVSALQTFNSPAEGTA